MVTFAQGCRQGDRQGARPGMGMLLTASVLCTALSACAQTEVWPSHQPLQHGTGSHKADELVQHLPIKQHAHHQPLVEPVSHRDCPLQPLRALQQAPGPAGLQVDVLIAAAFNYEPHTARAFLSTFRRHNQAARLILLVFPAQVQSMSLQWPAARTCLVPEGMLPTSWPYQDPSGQDKTSDPEKACAVA